MKEIKDLVSKDDLETAISNIKSKVVEKNNLFNEISLIENQYYRIQKDNRKGIIGYQDYTIEYSKVVNAIITFIDSVSESGLLNWHH